MSIEKLKEQVDGLQKLIAFLEDKPELAAKIYTYGTSLTVNVYGKGKEQKMEFLTTGGKRLEKKFSDYAVSVERKFSANVSLNVSISREAVCQRIVKEVKEHPSYVVEAYTEEIVEWKCK